MLEAEREGERELKPRRGSAASLSCALAAGEGCGVSFTRSSHPSPTGTSSQGCLPRTFQNFQKAGVVTSPALSTEDSPGLSASCCQYRDKDRKMGGLQ